MRHARPIIQALLYYRGALFRTAKDEKVLCLTFDDGPSGDVTVRILEILSECGLKSVFFCNGCHAEARPDIITMIRKEGHIIGNHGYYHLKGTGTSLENYISNTEKAAPLTSSRIFRPPYGLITPMQYKALSASYTIVFWDVMPYDYDPLFGSERSLKMALRKIRNGSIIALHDKPAATSPGFLRDLIKISLSEGYRFDIPDLLIHEG